MPVALVVVAAVEVAATVASTVVQKRAADAAANTAKTVASYNAAVDQQEANQTDLDAQAKIQAMRRDAATYMSKQASAFAAGGVVATTGSALAVQATTAGRAAMQQQQVWADANAKEQSLAAAGQAGIAEGAAQADQDHMEGVADVMQGAGKVASEVGSAYSGGAFGGGANTKVGLN